jgi:hypothetical protein
MDLIKLYSDFLNEAETNDSFEVFAQTRHDGAQKIAEAAKAKGGPSMLSYHHFVVKLPYYKKAAGGKFDLGVFDAEMEKQLSKLNRGLSGNISMSQTDFQRTMGIIEVLGELIIRFKK